MKTINKPENNMGGLIKIWAIPYNTFSISGKTVTFSSTENIYQIYCSPESMDFNEPLQREVSGIHYNTVINGFTPKDSEELQVAIEYLEPRKWVVIYIDGNGSYKLAGTVTEPLRLTSNLNSGKNTSDRAGCEITFAGTTLARAKFIDNPF